MTENDDFHLAKPGSFFGVYILYNINPKHKGKIYIGFTVNPERRIRQHNREIKGGAWKTGGDRGPWDMVLITHGFHTRLAALQFEWAWQNPTRSRRLCHLAKKTRKESFFSYRLRVLSEMLNTGPWNRLPLTIQWLKQEYMCDFPVEKPPPNHMPIAYGQITTQKPSTQKPTSSQKTSSSRKPSSSTQSTEDDNEVEVKKTCMLCEEQHTTAILTCIVSGCVFTSHTRCLCRKFLEQNNELEQFLIPVSGRCPLCEHSLMWGDVLKQKKYGVQFDDTDDSSSDDEFVT